MRCALFLLLLLCCANLRAQTAEQKKVIEAYFQQLPVCGPSSGVIFAIDNDHRFIADSVVLAHWVGFHLAGRVKPDFFPENKRIYLTFYLHEFADSVHDYYDSSATATIGCYFSHDDAGLKERDSLYTRFNADFEQVFPYHDRKKYPHKLRATLYKHQPKDKWACAVVASGYSKKWKGYYLSVYYDRRHRYDIAPTAPPLNHPFVR